MTDAEPTTPQTGDRAAEMRLVFAIVAFLIAYGSVFPFDFGAVAR